MRRSTLSLAVGLTLIGLTPAHAAFFFKQPSQGLLPVAAPAAAPVAPAVPLAFTLASRTLSNGYVGQAYTSFDFKTALGMSGDGQPAASAITWAVVGTLPAGLALSSTGVLSGTVTSAGSSTFQITASYQGTTTQQTYLIVAYPDALNVIASQKAPVGVTGMTLFQDSSVDDASVQLTLPFGAKFFGSSYTTAYVGSNTYITMGTGSSVYSSLSLTNPPLPGLRLGSADNSYQRVYQVNGTLNGVAFSRIRYEGNGSTSGTPGAPGIVAEVTFFAPLASRQLVEVVFGAHNRPTGVFGVSNASSSGTVNGGTIAPNTSYVFQSDATGNNWTITPGAHVE